MPPLFLVKYSNERGLSLLESALALAILGLIISGIWALSGSAFGSSKKNHLAEQVIYSVEGVRAYTRTTDLGTTVLSTDDAYNLGLTPTDIRRGGTYRNPYGGSFGIAASRNNLYITLTNIPADACVDLIYSRLGGSDNAADNLGFVGYAAGTGPPSITDFSFQTVTNTCSSTSDILLGFTPR